MDLGHSNVTTKATANGVTTETDTMSLAGDQNARTTSRLTFAGTEDLGGGLKASFNYETRLNPDNTASAGLDRTRNMFLNLSGGFGSVTIGTYLNSIDSLRGFTASTTGAAGGDFLANHVNVIGSLITLGGISDADLASDFGITGDAPAIAAQVASLKSLYANGLSARSTNSIGYSSPSFGGFTFSADMANEQSETDQAGLNTATGNTKSFNGSVGYAAGPLKALVVLGESKAELRTSSLGLSSSKSKDTGFAVSYNLGVAVPYIQYERTSVDITSFNGGAVSDAELKVKATEIGSKFPMGAFTPYLTVGTGKIGTGPGSVKTKAFQLGTTYDLSKRTQLYAAVGNFKLSNDEGFDAKTSGYKAGLVHNF